MDFKNLENKFNYFVVVKPSIYTYIFVYDEKINENKMFIYDEETKFFEELKAKSPVEPLSRTLFSLVAFNHQLYLFGGKHSQEHYSQELFFDDLWRFNPNTCEWNEELELFGDIPSARCSHKAEIIENKMIISGGFSEKGEQLNDSYSYDFETKRFTKLNHL